MIKVLVDVNLAPAWTESLSANRIEAVHWTTVGDPRADDEELLRYAREHGYVVFTHDLDFGTLLALTAHGAPVWCKCERRTSRPWRSASSSFAFWSSTARLSRRVLVTVDERAARVRILPIR